MNDLRIVTQDRPAGDGVSTRSRRTRNEATSRALIVAVVPFAGSWSFPGTGLVRPERGAARPRGTERRHLDGQRRSARKGPTPGTGQSLRTT